MNGKPRSPCVDYAVYLAVRIVVCILQIVPIGFALEAARLFAWLIHRVDRRHRLVAAENIRHAFPGLSQAEIDRMVRASYRHMCTMAVETIVLMRKLHAGNAAYLVRDADLEKCRFCWDLVRSDRPVIVMTGHVGNWEVMSLAMAVQGARASVVARPLDNPFLEGFIRRFRTSTGMRIVEKTGAVEEATAALARGGTLGLVGDQDAGPKGQFVNFFGRPASSFKSIALLSLQFQAPILVLGCVRTGEALEHLLFLEEAVMPEDFANHPAAVRLITERYTAALERIVRRNPEQYFWLHRRWKSQPPVRAKMAKLAA